MIRRSKIVVALVAVEAIFLLLPTTIFYTTGMAFLVIAGFSTANQGTFNPAFLPIAGVLTVPGYGLYCLWWLTLKFKSILLREVPWHIWGGLVVGGLTALLFILPDVRTGFAPQVEHISWIENFKTMLAFGGGPLVVLFTILGLMWFQDSRLNSSQLNH